MKFASLAAAALMFALPAFAYTEVTKTLTYSNTYDDPTWSLNGVACSNGVNGLYTRGYATLGDLPTFPNLGGVYTVSGWNSTYCGTCYQVTYGTETINVTAVDVSEGFNLSEEAMNTLTGGLAYQLGKVNVTSIQVASSVCGL